MGHTAERWTSVHLQFPGIAVADTYKADGRAEGEEIGDSWMEEDLGDGDLDDQR
jgi:hypothetical protein